MKVKELDVIIRKSGVKGYLTKSKDEKQRIVALIKKSKPLLKNLAKRNKLKITGNKKDLLKRIVEKQKHIIKNVANINVFEGKDVEEVVDNFAFFDRKRIRSDANSIRSLYDKVEEYREKYDATHNLVMVAVYFKNKNNNRYLHRSINFGKYFGGIEQLEQWFDNINNEPDAIRQGSSGINNEEYTNYFNAFDIILSKHNAGGDKKIKYLLFKSSGIELNDGLCGFSCLQQCNIDITEDCFRQSKLNELQCMKEYIRLNNLNINVVGNHLKIKKRLKRSDMKKINNMYLYKLSVEDVVIPFLNGKKNDCNNFIIYDIKKEHYVYSNKIELDEIYCDLSYVIYKKIDDVFEKIMSVSENLDTQVEYGLIENEIMNIEYIFFDYETVTDWKELNVNKPYNLNILICSESALELLDTIEQANDEKRLDKFCEENSKTFVGFDCTRKLIDYIMKNQTGKVFHFVSFNGCNFDNYILYNDCLKLNIDNLVSKPFISNGQILNFKIFGRHEMLDIRKYIGSSLLEMCYSFDIKLCKKIENFDHYYMQKKYEEGNFEHFINNSEELKKYNIFDCLSLALIFFRFKKAIEGIKCFKGQKIDNHMTLGSFVMRKFEDHVKKSKITLPNFYDNNDEKLNKRLMCYYNDILNNRIAGRVQLFNGIQKIEERIASLDVCSLYPYSMFINQNYYPYGEIIEVKKYDKKPKDLIGFFYCNVDETNMEVKILAEKVKNGNNWDYKNTLKNIFLSSIMIEYIKKNGGKVIIKNGIYFTKKIKGCELFDFLLDIMKLKNEQDIFKENKNTSYNPVMREVYKLILNILSGKLNQKLNREERKIVNQYEFIQLKDEIKDLNTITAFGDKAHITYKKSEKDCIKKAKPIYIGTLIYDYSRMYMHDNMYTKCKYSSLIYTDTDSNKLRIGDFNLWKEYATNVNVPHWKEIEEYDERYKNHKLYSNNSKVFGSFEDEYKDNNNNLSYFLAKKQYLNIDSDIHNKMLKMKFETKRDKELYLNKYANFHFKGITKKDVVVSSDKKILSSKELNDIYNSSEIKRIKDDYITFFEKLYREKEITILTCNLQKIHNNLKKDVDIDDKDRMVSNCYNIITSYRLKKIKL